MAFVEPDGWFQGAPILRSKFSVVAQDQIRSLRRGLRKRKGNEITAAIGPIAAASQRGNPGLR